MPKPNPNQLAQLFMQRQESRGRDDFLRQQLIESESKVDVAQFAHSTTALYTRDSEVSVSASDLNELKVVSNLVVKSARSYKNGTLVALRQKLAAYSVNGSLIRILIDDPTRQPPGNRTLCKGVHQSPVCSLDFSPAADGNEVLLASVDTSGLLAVWSITDENGELSSSLKFREQVGEGLLFSVQWMPDSNTVLAVSGAPSVVIFEISEGNSFSLAHPSPSSSVSFHPTKSNLLVTGCDDGTIRVWNWKKQNVVSEIEGAFPSTCSVSWRDVAGISYLVASGDDNRSFLLFTETSDLSFTESSSFVFSGDDLQIPSVTVDATGTFVIGGVITNGKNGLFVLHIRTAINGMSLWWCHLSFLMPLFFCFISFFSLALDQSLSLSLVLSIPLCVSSIRCILPASFLTHLFRLSTDQGEAFPQRVWFDSSALYTVSSPVYSISVAAEDMDIQLLDQVCTFSRSLSLSLSFFLSFYLPFFLALCFLFFLSPPRLSSLPHLTAHVHTPILFFVRYSTLLPRSMSFPSTPSPAVISCAMR